MDIVDKLLSLLVVRVCIHPGVVAAPGNDDVIFTIVIRQVYGHIEEGNSPLLSIEISHLRVGYEGVISFTLYTLTIDIEELIAWLAAIFMHNTGENLVPVAKVFGRWLPDEVHTHFIRLKQVIFEIVINLRKELSMIAELRVDARIG